MNETWKDDALCVQTDPELFFPVRGPDSFPQRAKAVCDCCTVREQCLEYALAAKEMWGIWGGTSPQERENILKSRRAAGEPIPPMPARSPSGLVEELQHLRDMGISFGDAARRLGYRQPESLHRQINLRKRVP